MKWTDSMLNNLYDNLRSIGVDDGGWRKHTPYHWSREPFVFDTGIAYRIDFWPTTNKLLFTDEEGEQYVETMAAQLLADARERAWLLKPLINHRK